MDIIGRIERSIGISVSKSTEHIGVCERVITLASNVADEFKALQIDWKGSSYSQMELESRIVCFRDESPHALPKSAWETLYAVLSKRGTRVDHASGFRRTVSLKNTKSKGVSGVRFTFNSDFKEIERIMKKKLHHVDIAVFSKNKDKPLNNGSGLRFSMSVEQKAFEKDAEVRLGKGYKESVSLKSVTRMKEVSSFVLAGFDEFRVDMSRIRTTVIFDPTSGVKVVNDLYEIEIEFIGFNIRTGDDIKRFITDHLYVWTVLSLFLQHVCWMND